MPDQSFECRAPDCHRCFQTVTGRGVHERRAHPTFYDQQQLESNPARKNRWTKEELLLLARKEAELSSRGVRFMNQELQKFSDRTLEAIKGQRRTAEYREMVGRFMEELRAKAGGNGRGELEGDNGETGDDTGNQIQNLLKEYLLNIEAPTNDDYNARWLFRIAGMVDRESKERVLLEIAAYMRETFIPENKNRNISSNNNKRKKCGGDIYRNKREKRRMEYARIQDLWRKNSGSCVNRIITDTIEQEPGLGRHLMEPYWKELMESSSDAVPDLPNPQGTQPSLWAPITEDELRRAFPATRTSAGPDGVTSKQLRRIPSAVLSRLFNLFMWCGGLPGHLYKSRTVLIPKKKGATSPGLFRPITVSSVFLRLFHRVLADRMGKIIIDERQRAFIKSSGCAENIALLDLALSHRSKKQGKLFMAILDLAKAFDSLSFAAIERTLISKGVPKEMADYVMKIYREGSTVLQHGGWQSSDIHPRRGVRQGDPLSPLIFNWVMDGMIRSIPAELGVDVGGRRLSVLAFADDLVLFASSERGLQELLGTVSAFLANCGLTINVGKSQTISWKTIPRQKKSVVDTSCKFKIGSSAIPTVSRSDRWSYLGVQVTADGITHPNLKVELETYLQRLTKAPLKPQQRLWALRTIIIPKLMYSLVLSKTTLSLLKRLDAVLRASVRKWLGLPKDAPNAYIHASIPDGGLGIHSMRWRAPLERLKCLEKIKNSDYLQDQTTQQFIENNITQTSLRLKDNTNTVINTNRLLSRFWGRVLHSSVDGAGLKGSGEVIGQHRWISENTKFLSGRDFINSLKLRINALPTRSRTSRGRQRDRSCRAGCHAVETSNHILQICHRTHGMRIKRHDAVVNYLKRNLIKQGYTVESEPHFNTSQGLRKPDLVASVGHTSIVIDAQVVGDQTDLGKADRDKVAYYSGNSSLSDLIKAKYCTTNVLTLSATLNWRGVWSPRSADNLLKRGIIKRTELKVLSSRVLIGGLASWNIFNKSTSYRGGVG